MSIANKRVFRFGVFEADPASGELRKAGVRLRLQEQPFKVLLLLLERPGDVITREEIRRELWPCDTFVDFDHSLNTIINKIREALTDSAANPRFVETLAKRGYRFLVPVASITDPRSHEREPLEKSLVNGMPRDVSFPSTLRLTRREDLPTVSRGYTRALFFLIQMMYLIFYIVALGRLWAVQDVLERSFGGHPGTTIVLIVSASIGIPLRLFMLSAVAFDIKDLSRKFLSLFAGVVVLDELWALSPFLLAPQIGLGLALGITAALAYLPFAQRTLVLMQERRNSSSDASQKSGK